MTADEPTRYVIHLPISAPDLPRARILARTAARSLSFLAVDARETTVSEEDNQGVHHRVFCDRLLDDGRRCVLRAEHETPCAPRVPR
ncbi:hypothetical protein [Micromonospora sp. NBC_01796]|uniref:hypothetical protein n=1 Tax=Micromonospora sp. NBC_01796 TaxID=2975987 RepID=UPI002DD82D4C|nr:hypothetical protein [Micromonospora sp. NBC_01796]WSA88508.1 hypothetical protein OIE47_13380 [Micromonospora sp. NBC_01796]